MQSHGSAESFTLYKYLYQGSVRRCCLIMDHRSYMLGCLTTRIIKRLSNILKWDTGQMVSLKPQMVLC